MKRLETAENYMQTVWKSTTATSSSTIAAASTTPQEVMEVEEPYYQLKLLGSGRSKHVTPIINYARNHYKGERLTPQHFAGKPRSHHSLST